LGRFIKTSRAMKSFLISGVSGFLGVKLAKFLLLHNHRVIGLARQKNNSILLDLKSNPNFVYFDGGIKENNLKRLNPFDIDGVYHLASQIPNDDNISYSRFYESNVNTTLLLIRYFQNRSISFFVYTSTNSVFGDPIEGVIDEKSIPTPLNYYALTKYIGEKIINIERHKLKAKHIVIRLCSLFGLHDTYGFINTITSAIGRNQSLELFSQGDVYKTFLNADDAVKLLGNIIDKYTDLESFEIFQIAGEKSLRAIDIAQFVKKQLKSSSSILLSDKKSRYDWNIFVDINKAKRKLDFQPMTMEESITNYLNQKRDEV
jgi:nucleoside-diphosphate-sugar epimerase